VARRIVGLFVVSALVPIVGMAVISFFAVTSQLEDQSRERLAQLTRNAGMSVLQQLRGIETTLHQVRARTDLGAAVGQERGALGLAAVTALGIVGADGQFLEAVGSIDQPGPLSESERDRLSRDGMILRAASGGGGVIHAAVSVDPGDPAVGTLWAVVVGDSIWGAAETFVSLPSVEDFCLLSAPDDPLYCTSGGLRFPDAYAADGSVGRPATSSYQESGDRLMVGHWSFFPDSNFDAPPWTTLVVENMESVYAPTDTFARLFGGALALAILLVVLLSNVQIRRTLEPLAALEKGTARIASGELATRVAVTSNDEFGALATSFNAMASNLGDLFAQSEAMRVVGQAALAAFKLDDVIVAALEQLPSVSSCRSAAVLVVHPRNKQAAEIRWLTAPGELGGTKFELPVEDLRWMRDHPDHGFDADDAPAFFDEARGGLGNGRLVAFPHLVKGDVQGVTLVEFAPGADALEEATAARVRQIVNQVAVALDDVRLVQDLENLSWGAIIAFARAIDAKSEWTWGHSERVTEMALALGRAMKLDDEDLDTIHRGGLLHDIGKIGVPGEILDKAGKLTDDEIAKIREHPAIGEKILLPIRAFAPALPLVLYHHEKWDGTGYPHGLAGSDIPFLARILAVADAYDAMVSARPYRPALDPSVVVQRIINDSGTHFDPAIVEVLVTHMARHESVEIEEVGRVAS